MGGLRKFFVLAYELFLLGDVGWTKDKIDTCGLSKQLGTKWERKKKEERVVV